MLSTADVTTKSDSSTREPDILTGRVALVTGASSGIGRAITLSLAGRGARICAIGRNSKNLESTKAAAAPNSDITIFPLDLTQDEDLNSIPAYLSNVGRLDILVHCAGVIHRDRMEDASIEDFDVQYAANVRAPYALTKSLIPLLTAARGQVVFLNSTAGVGAARADIGQYAATKHALRAVADSLRAELNPRGVRVLSLYLGRTASPMQERLSREEGRIYHPETLLQPEDVASVVLHALLLPATAEITDLTIRPMIKPVL